MIPLGLTADEQREFHLTLTRDHDIDVRVSLLDMDERHLGDMSGWLLAGQVVVDADEAVTRSCQITLLDPEGRAGVDSSNPAWSVWLDRMISVSYGVWVESLGRWVRTPLFRGPITKASRDGAVLEIEALGKEHLLRNDGGIVKSYAAGIRRTTVIRDILQRMGERNMVVPSWPARTSQASVMPKLGAQSDPWPWIEKIAKSIRAQAFYDGAGTFRLRYPPTRTSWWWYESHLLSTPKISVDDAELVNTVWVKGQPPEGKKWVIEAHGSLPAWHHKSPESLGRRGVPRYVTEVVEDDSIRTVADAETARDRRLKEIIADDVTAEFECFPVPHLDPEDVGHLAWGDDPVSFRIRKFTVPLVASESMSVGYAKRTKRRGIYARRGRAKAKG